MAVTVDTSAVGPSGTGSTLTITGFTPGATANALYVGIGYNDGVDTVSSVTWNGAAESFTSLFDNGPSSTGTSGWLLLNPTITTANIVVTYTGPIADSQNAGVVSLIGVNTSAGVAGATRSIFSGSGTGTTLTVDVTDCVSGDLVIDTACVARPEIFVDASQTSRAEDQSIQGGFLSFGISTETAVSATTTMSWTCSSSNPWVTRAFAFIPSGGTPITGLRPAICL